MSEKPRRIQRRRTKGWRMPDGAVYVGRPTRWGNLSVIEPHIGGMGWQVRHSESGAIVGAFTKSEAARFAVATYTTALHESPQLARQAEHELAGRDLVCWCPLNQPCHADVLLDLANREVGGKGGVASTPTPR